MSQARIAVLTSQIFAVLVAGFVIYQNYSPFGSSVTLNLSGSKTISTGLVPSYRVENGKFLKGKPATLTDDFVYYNVPDSGFSTATAQVAYKSDNADQKLNIGFQDSSQWHYAAKTVSSAYMDTLNWDRLGSGPYLYQKKAAYKTFQEFLDNPPEGKVVGLFDYEEAKQANENRIANYKPSATQTTINTMLRGKVIMYVYLDGEAFDMKISKRDLNWYSDPDPAFIHVYKGEDQVFQYDLNDDGNEGDSRVPGPEQVAIIKNPGPELPEAGVYKIVIDASSDSVITQISTNLQKIIFSGPLYSVNNTQKYGKLGSEVPTQFTTNVPAVTLKTYHDTGLQTVTLGQSSTTMNSVLEDCKLMNQTSISTLVLPKSDVIINGAGYFSYTASQFFSPTKYNYITVSSEEDLAQSDYVVTNYQKPKDLGDGWKQATVNFDLKGAVAQKGQLSWIIQAPGLKESGNTVEIKDIQMTLTKQGWLDKWLHKK